MSPPTILIGHVHPSYFNAIVRAEHTLPRPPAVDTRHPIDDPRIPLPPRVK